jgi:transcriptional regulator with XRE-family HTH domain
MQNVVQLAIRDSRFTRRELARRAGVSASTITRIEKGEIDPTLGMATRILAAAGLQLPSRTEPLCDVRALHAARTILESSTSNSPAEEVMIETLMRWASPDGTPRPRSLAREAGASAPPPLRPGALGITSDWNFLRICSAVAATRKGWAASGAPAAARIGAQEKAGPTILYVENPARVASIINRPGPAAVEVLLLPLDGTSEGGAWNDEGMVWADPIQIILDCYGMPATYDLAEELTKDWRHHE